MVRVLSVASDAVAAAPGSITTIWKLRDRHATYLFDADAQGHDTVINGQVPAQFHNVERYCGPAGLGEIMR